MQATQRNAARKALGISMVAVLALAAFALVASPASALDGATNLGGTTGHCTGREIGTAWGEEYCTGVYTTDNGLICVGDYHSDPRDGSESCSL